MFEELYVSNQSISRIPHSSVSNLGGRCLGKMRRRVEVPEIVRDGLF
jgi:hypothetical protein